MGIFPSMIKQQIKQILHIEYNFQFFALLVIIGLGLWVRIAFLSVPIRFDEAWTYNFYASKPLTYGLSRYIDPNNHLLNTFLVHLSSTLFGNKPWIIRLPAFVFGFLLIPITYFASRFFYNRDAALLAAGLVASSSVLVQYSANARGYTMVSFAFMTLLFIAGHIVQRKKPGLLWGAFIVTAVLGFYAIPTMLYPFVLILVLLIFPLYKNKLLRALIIAVGLTGVLTLLLYLPVIVSSGTTSLTSNDYVKATAFNIFLPAFLENMPVVWQEWNRDIPFFIQLIFLIGFFVAVFAARDVGISQFGMYLLEYWELL